MCTHSPIWIYSFVTHSIKTCSQQSYAVKDFNNKGNSICGVNPPVSINRFLKLSASWLFFAFRALYYFFVTFFPAHICSGSSFPSTIRVNFLVFIRRAWDSSDPPVAHLVVREAVTLQSCILSCLDRTAKCRGVHFKPDTRRCTLLRYTVVYHLSYELPGDKSDLVYTYDLQTNLSLSKSSP